VYPINAKGAVKYAWKLRRPNDRYGRPVGLEPYVQLGVQYAIRGEYTITNDIPGDGGLFSGRTIFTPMVANFSGRALRLIANYDEDDQVITDYLIPQSTDSSLTYAPYFYWNGSSNIRLESIQDSYTITFRREDTTGYRKLELDGNSLFSGSGRTAPVTAN
jgi:hypothetical protein